MSHDLLIPALGILLTASACGDSTTRRDGGGPDVADGAPALDATGAGEYCPVVGYTACGGDLVGTWAFRGLCPEDPVAAAALCEHPYDDRAECVGVGNEAVCDGTHTGTLTFGADGSLEVDTTATVIATWSFSDECLVAVVPTGATAEERCANLGSERLSCAYDGGCTCVGDPNVETHTNVATYRVTGDDLILGDDPPATYCIADDILTMDYYAFHPISWRYWVLERE